MDRVGEREPAVLRPDDLQRVEAPGVIREVAFDEELDAVEGQRVLVQRTFNQPGDASDWHVHPNYTTYGYQLTGQLWVEFGPGGSKRIECGAGDFVRIPASCVQREGAFGDSPRRGIGVRIGSGPPVVDVDGPDPWDATPGEPDPAAPRSVAAAQLVTSLPTGAQPHVIREADLERLESRGLLREVAFEEELRPIAGQRVLMERSHQEPGEVTGWQMHPNYVSYAYQMSGRLRIEFGAGGCESVEAGPGDFVRIPAGMVYRARAVGDSPRVGVGIRIGSGVLAVECSEPPASNVEA
jgi:quercetin dioxygenase-like cupin family protein